MLIYHNIIDGASNTLLLTEFLLMVMDIVDANGEPALRRGDFILLDNCPFHHVRDFVELMQVSDSFIDFFSFF